MILQSVPPLPETPLLERLLFESPLAVVIALSVVGVIVAQQLLARDKARAAAMAFLGAAGVVAALLLTANAVVTDRETIRSESASLIDHIVAVASRKPGGAEALRDQLAQSITLTEIPSAPPEITRPALITMIQSRLDGSMSIADHRIREIQATTDGPNVARSHVLVRATPASLGRPVNTSWRMHWQRPDAASPWTLVELELLDIDAWAKGRR